MQLCLAVFNFLCLITKENKQIIIIIIIIIGSREMF